jgi:hypothetical protein
MDLDETANLENVLNYKHVKRARHVERKEDLGRKKYKLDDHVLYKYKRTKICRAKPILIMRSKAMGKKEIIIKNQFKG